MFTRRFDETASGRRGVVLTVLGEPEPPEGVGHRKPPGERPGLERGRQDEPPEVVRGDLRPARIAYGAVLGRQVVAWIGDGGRQIEEDLLLGLRDGMQEKSRIDDARA